MSKDENRHKLDVCKERKERYERYRDTLESPDEKRPQHTALLLENVFWGDAPRKSGRYRHQVVKTL